MPSKKTDTAAPPVDTGVPIHISALLAELGEPEPPAPEIAPFIDPTTTSQPESSGEQS